LAGRSSRPSWRRRQVGITRLDRHDIELQSLVRCGWGLREDEGHCGDKIGENKPAA